MIKATKIVATIGPATESEEIMAKLIRSGMDVARFNTKHSDPDWHNERIERVKKVAAEMNQPIGILLDLQGPEIRINLPDEAPFEVEVGDEVTFTSSEQPAEKRTIQVPHQVIESLEIDNEVLLDDGNCEFVITQKLDTELQAKALIDCTVKHRKTMNTPGVVLDMPSLTDRDREYLNGVKPELIDFVGLSFVRDKTDIETLRGELKQRQINADIIAKIENQSALDNINEIIEATDSVMIARGDLGVEVEYQELVYWQKLIIRKCREAAKPVITATQMLKSMVDQPRPSRAEVSDVAHAIYDGTDAVMLSEETTIGKYPVRAVATQAEIAAFNEPYTAVETTWPSNISSSLNVTSAAANLLLHSKQQIDKIICFTETGRTAKLIARFRPKVPILVATHNTTTYNQLTLIYGVHPFLLTFPSGPMEADEKFFSLLKDAGMARTGEMVLLIYGSVWKQAGLTNTLSLVKIK